MTGRDLPAVSGTHQPTAPLAVVAAILSVVLARVLFPLAESGPGSAFLTVAFPFVSGGAAFLAARYAVRAWRATRAEDESPGFKGLQLTLIVAALIADLMVLAFAAFIGLMILTGPMVG